MKPQKSTVEYNGIVYEVILDEKSIVWIIDPRNNKKTETNIGETEMIHSIEDARTAVLRMLQASEK